MKKIITLIFLILTFSFAENNASDFIETGLSARSLALGNATVAVGSGIDQIFSNPAALAGNVNNMEMTSSMANNFGEVERKNIGWAGNAKELWLGDEYAVYGFNLSNSFIDNIPETEWGLEDRPEVKGSFKSEKYNYTFTYSREYNNYLAYGFNLKNYSYQISNFQANGIGLDAGVLYKMPENILNSPIVLAASVKNIGRTSLSWSTGFKESIPMTLSVGMAVYKSLWNKKIVLATQLNQIEDEDLSLHSGVEYWLADNLCALRLGSDNGRLGLGLGVIYNDLILDYAQADYEDLGLINRVTVSVKF